MKITILSCLYAVLFISLSCTDTGTIPTSSAEQENVGNMLLRFAEAPTGITAVTARLSRSGYVDRTINLSISDSSASGSFNEVPVGTWHLRIEARDSASVVRYSGETDVNVTPGQTAQVSLQLLPTAGSIVITVTWGTPGHDPSLVLYYPFNGNANDESGHNHHGIINNVTLVADRFGNPNKAYSFNGTSSFIDAGTSNALNPTNGLSISVWIKYNGGSNTTEIVSRWDAALGVNERTYTLSINPSHRLYFRISPDGSDANAAMLLDTASTATGSWTHIAATWNGSTIRLYKNGNQIATGIVNGMRISPNTRTGVGALLGRYGDPTVASFNGAIDDIRLYNRALTQQEVQTLYGQ